TMVKSARQTDALALAAGEPDPALPSVRIKPIWQFVLNEVEDLSHRASFAQACRINLIVGQAKSNVPRDCVVNEKDILWHITDGGLPRGHQRRCKRLIIDQDLACRRLIEPKQ